MAKVTQKELLTKYGISLSKGKYDIIVDGNKYKIYTVKDDTDGCILLGLNKVKGAVINSQNAMAFFMDKTPDTFELVVE